MNNYFHLSFVRRCLAIVVHAPQQQQLQQQPGTSGLNQGLAAGSQPAGGGPSEDGQRAVDNQYSYV